MLRRRTCFVLALAVALPGCGLYGRVFHRSGHSRAEARPRPPAIDLNTASLKKVEALSGITPSMAKRIVDGRPYTRPHDLVDRGILTDRELDRIEDEVTIPDAR